MSKRRVVVTGLGIVSPVGSTVANAWAAILRGESGIGPITRFDVSAFPTRFGGAVRDFDVAQYIPPKEARRMDEFMHYGVAAGDAGRHRHRHRFRQARPRALRRRHAAPASAASGRSSRSTTRTWRPTIRARSRRSSSRHHHQHDLGAPVDPATACKGPNLGVVTACTTSTHAIGLGCALHPVR